MLPISSEDDDARRAGDDVLVTVTLEGGGASGIDATDLSHLLRKHPARVQTFDAPVGRIHVFYPEVTPRRTTAAMLLEVDPIDLARTRRFRGDAFALDHYVNDRPYAASSLVAVALGRVFRSAMTGESESHPDLAARPLPLRIAVPAVPARGRGADDLVRRLFEPLGWHVDARPIPLDTAQPAWGDSRYVDLTLTGTVRLSHALRQLYVLLPVLDDAKHYWVDDDEAAKLVRQGEGWLPGHPERQLITRRYLAHQGSLVALADDAFGRPADAAPDDDDPADRPLRELRADAVLDALHDVAAHRVVDMGCGTGMLLQRLRADRSFTRIVGVDVDPRSLQRAAARLHVAEASDAERERLVLLHGSAVYRDDRLRGFDAVVLMEVVEHVDPPRLPALEDAVFTFAQPATVVVTTPNRDYNALFPGLAPGALRHDDHRFEWSRAEFCAWVDAASARHGYTAEIRPVGPVDADHGPATQLAVFRRNVA